MSTVKIPKGLIDILDDINSVEIKSHDTDEELINWLTAWHAEVNRELNDFANNHALYEQGRADVETELLESKDSDELSQKIAIDILERGIAKGRESGIREFAEWLESQDYLTHIVYDEDEDFDGNIVHFEREESLDVDEILAEYEKEKKNG